MARRPQTRRARSMFTQQQPVPSEGEIAATAPEANNAPLRPDPRPDMRADASKAEDSRARAARRAAELSGQTELNEAPDKFHIPAEIIPDGWGYEWKRISVLGARDPGYEVSLAQQGWEAVPAERHPAFMPPGHRGVIERDGMVLMERPLITNERAKARDQATARQQMRQKEEQLNAAPQGQFDRRKSDGTSLASVKRDYAHVPVPE